MHKLQAHEPLSRSELYIMIALAGKERHGYEITQYVKAVSQGGVRLGPGTLYVALKRLLDSGLIADAGKRKETDKRERKYYKLTERGRKVLGAELSRLQAFLSVPNVRRLIKTV